ncbi:hypothetical protein AX14_012297, partial [Amanita brunnescens Koide BX004]
MTSSTASSGGGGIDRDKRSLFSTAGIIIAPFIAMLSNIVALSGSNVVLPDLGKNLNMQQDSLQWVLSTFALSS